MACQCCLVTNFLIQFAFHSSKIIVPFSSLKFQNPMLPLYSQPSTLLLFSLGKKISSRKFYLFPIKFTNLNVFKPKLYFSLYQSRLKPLSPRPNSLPEYLFSFLLQSQILLLAIIPLSSLHTITFSSLWIIPIYKKHAPFSLL